LKSPEAFDVWLLRIDQNNARRFLSTRLHRNEDLNDDEWEKDLPEVNEDLLPEKNFEKIQISGQLMSTIMSLSIRQREAVVLYYYEGLSYAEIADLMGTTIQTVSTNLLKAKRRIKSELEARAGGGVWS
jgi:RNA polymerase sigma-70 factor (ECF subfamily)